VERDDAYADILLDRAQRSFPDPRDRAFLTELVMGTLRRRALLDAAYSGVLSRPIDETDVWTRNALRLGVYQLLHTRTPERAAVFETVEAVKRRRGAAAAGLVNAVLREVARKGGAGELPGAPKAERSAPVPLASALARSLGREDAAAFLAACMERPPFTVRANPFRTSREALLRQLSRAGMAPSRCRFAADGIVLSEPAGVHADPAFRKGEYVVMDEGAQLIAPLLAPRAGEKILDACAAPGGKTTHLAALACGRAQVLATDVSDGRVRLLRETVARTGARGVALRVHDFARAPLPAAGGSDKVLVDAPCTGMGVVRRNPDAKWRFRPEGLAEMARLQGAILDNAWAAVRAGGFLAYCTCSPLREENEDVAAAFLGRHADAALCPGGPGHGDEPEDAWTPEGFLRLMPHRHGTDGFCAAVFVRRA